MLAKILSQLNCELRDLPSSWRDRRTKKSLSPAPVGRLALCKENTFFETDDKILKLMQTSRDLYALKKRFAYLLAFVELVKAKF